MDTCPAHQPDRQPHRPPPPRTPPASRRTTRRSGSGRPWPRTARTRRCAEAQLGAGDRTGGGQTLGQARLVAQACGLLRAVRLADELAARAGLGPPRPDGGGEDGAAGDGAGALVAGEAPLTARERQVLQLLAQGLTNRQIGEQLFISDKTASVHVSAILRKLGASTRTQAAARARNVPG